MLRLIVMALRSFFFLIYEINKCNYMMKRPEKYSELDKYREVQKIVDKMRKNSRTTTKVYGKENLPETGIVLENDTRRLPWQNLITVR